MITVSVWHNVAHDAEGGDTAMLDGYQPGHPMVRVFAYQADPGGRAPVAIAEEAFTICNGHPRTPVARSCPAATTHASCGRYRSATSSSSAKSRSRSAASAGASSAAA